MAGTIQQEQLNRFFELLAASKLPSELELLTQSATPNHFLVIQSGTNDAQKITVEKLRGGMGNFDASTSLPNLSNGTGTEKDSYIVSVAGTVDFGNGNVKLEVDDIIEYREGKWRLLVNKGFDRYESVDEFPYEGTDKKIYLDLLNKKMYLWVVDKYELISGITSQAITDALGYTPLETETDPTVPHHVKDITVLEVANWNDAFAKKSVSISVTGDVNKLITLTREDGSTLTASFNDNNDGTATAVDNFVNTAEFNLSNDGVLSLLTTENNVITVSIDGRYSLLGHGHSATEISETTDRKWLSATERSNIVANNSKVSYPGDQDLSGKVDKITGKGLSANDYTNTEKTKLTGIESNATADQTNLEIVNAVNTQLGNTDWQTQKTLEQIQDIIGAMFQSGTQTNITVDYNDTNGTLNLTGNLGGGATLTDEQVQDIVGAFSTSGTGISVNYNDAGNIITFSLTGESFTTAYKNKLDGIAANANNYVHPTSHPATIIAQTSSYRFVTDAEKSTWNSKQAALGFTPDKKRTRKEVNVTTQYTLIAADFTDFYLDFTANGGQTISLILNAGVMPDNGELRVIQSGNNKLTYTAGTGTVLFKKPDGATLTTVPYGWSGLVKATAANTYSVNGSLESTGGGVGLDVRGSNLVSDLSLVEKTTFLSKIGAGERQVKAISTSTYTVVNEDKNKLLLFIINGGNVTINIPNGTFPIGNEKVVGFSYFNNVIFNESTGNNSILVSPGDLKNVEGATKFELDFILGDTCYLTGSLIKEYEIFKTSTGVLKKLTVNDNNTITVANI